MTNTIDQVIQYAKDHPKRDGKSWAGWCESFVWRAGGFAGSFSSALLAGNASGPLNPNWGQAPRGALHYWAGVGGDGHVAFELGGGTLLMASSRTSSYGTALGAIHFTDYGLPLYRGWTMRHGTETLARTSLAGSFTELEEIDMALDDTDKTWLNGMGASIIDQVADKVIERVGGTVWGHDLKHAAGAHAPAATWLLNTSDMVGAIQAKPSTVIDPVKLAAALKAAGLTVTIDQAALVKALDASLSDDFAAIPGAVRSAIIK
ncbi:hypothetical protein C3B59_10500 [Cryobacterium zongtaii]|uniref:Uncharacterized protein n=1 Tax=Cryobacterium zongtaii TaxID=1259217 RepID=A0A2S3ZCI8_9MICO|nr:hypothetical protein [Cryobacterium zongtaii]POH63965.1 hypothetical protein C3B59_10500 [Cryobacterium zongtaii]